MVFNKLECKEVFWLKTKDMLKDETIVVTRAKFLQIQQMVLESWLLLGK